jgi:hypothetical protein
MIVFDNLNPTGGAQTAIEEFELVLESLGGGLDTSALFN